MVGGDKEDATKFDAIQLGHVVEMFDVSAQLPSSLEDIANGT